MMKTVSVDVVAATVVSVCVDVVVVVAVVLKPKTLPTAAATALTSCWKPTRASGRDRDRIVDVAAGSIVDCRRSPPAPAHFIAGSAVISTLNRSSTSLFDAKRKGSGVG